MSISVFQLFSIGLGPSSSHTVGPMRAALQFAQELRRRGYLDQIAALEIELFGSLALTGKGHATDVAVMLGLEGETPQGVDPNSVTQRIETIREKKQLHFLGERLISFSPDEQIHFLGDKFLPYHPNAMKFKAYDKQGKQCFSQLYYSLGGGFIVEHEQAINATPHTSDQPQVPHPFKTGQELLDLCSQHNLTIPQLMMKNELTWRSEDEIRSGLLNIWQVMQACAQRGCEQDGVLPGGLNLKRRAPGMYRSLTSKLDLPLEERCRAEVMDWVSLWAMAVNEENAACGRVVTAPTNGAAGVIPAVLHYYVHFIPNAHEQGIIDFLLAAAAMGILYKEGASISAAEMGCMGEVGVACSMAAAGLVAAKGGTNEQIENAAEIGMEHNLGLTCDPVKGLVQIPCIERNTMGANKAINAARLAYLHGDGSHKVTLDQVIATMRQTGQDMKSHYKETSQGGLAVNVPEC